MHHLYLITNLVNGKQYVGITAHPNRRWRKHRTGRGSRLIKAAIDKYGIDNLLFSVIYKSPDLGCIEWMEHHAIAGLGTLTPNGYNLNEGGGGAPPGIKPSMETIAKRAASNRGKKRSAEFCARLAAVARMRMYSEATRSKMSLRRKGHSSSEKQKASVRAIRSKPVFVDGARYPSITAAALSIGVNQPTLSRQFQRYKKNNSFPTGWGYEAIRLSRVS